MADETAVKEPKAKKERTKNPCLCGCNTPTFGKWAPGHDARVYSAIRKVAAGKMTETELQKTFTKAAVEECRSKAH